MKQKVFKIQGRSIRYLGFIASFLMLGIMYGVFVPPYTHLDSSLAATGTAQESTMTLAMTSNTASVDLAVNSTTGTFAKSSTNNEAAFSVTTNNFTGYTLGISASDDNGALVNGSNTLSSISSSLSESAFDVTANNGKWGWKPSKLNSSTNTDFLPSPTTEAVTLDTTSAANSTANNYTIALGARADYTKPAGTYTKTFILTAVANKINYSVTYNANSGTDAVTNMPYPSTNNTQSGDTSSTTITLSNLVPVRVHYSFLGWCLGTSTTSNITTTNGVDSCSSTIYNPNGGGTNLTYGIDQTTINESVLRAMWKIDTFTCTKRYNLQNADGTYPSTYTEAGTETVNYGGTCSYTQSYTDYQTQSTSATNIDADTTLSLSLPRNTYALTINKNDSYISSVTGAGTYRWGQAVSISATASSGNEFTTWSQTSGTTGTFGSTTSASTTFTMPKSAATIYADGKSSCNALPAGTGIMQTYSITAATLASVCVGSSTTLKDNRDNSQYLVAKLADGKIWLLDNLRLDLTNSTIRNALTASNTNATETSLTSLRSGNRNAGAQYASSGFATWISSPNVFNQAKANADYKETINEDASLNYGPGSHKYGVYYNYCAASAGSYCYDSGAGTGNASQDICPKGWRMPTGGSSGEYEEYEALYRAYSSNVTNFLNALSTPLSGSLYSGSPRYQGEYGEFWSAAYHDGFSMRRLLVFSSSVDHRGHTDRDYGLSVRCVFGT